ncbi:MAG: hypothetical protein ACO31D_02095 [Ilumatobacteraceae bacterium]
MKDPRFADLIRSAERVFGCHKRGDASEGWPGGDELGLHEDNVVEFATREYETFATWFDERGNGEVLAVITNVHPVKDFTDFIDEVQEKLPADLEIENPECEVGTPICVAFTLRADAPTSGDSVNLRLRQLRKIADFVAQEVAA